MKARLVNLSRCGCEGESHPGELLRSQGLPAALMGYPQGDPLIPAAHAEVGHTGLVQAAPRLVDLGHRHIAFALMAEQRRPTVMVFANDSMTIAAAGALQRNGYEVPEDVSVVGHDDLAFGQWVHPRLTTISQNLHQIGRVSGLPLLQLLGTDAAQLPRLTRHNSWRGTPALVLFEQGRLVFLQGTALAE